MRINPKIIELIGDVSIPLIGYFLWDWSLYFILLFSLLDLLVKEVIIHLKTRRDRQKQPSFSPTFWLRRGVISAALLVLFVLIAHFSMQNIQPGIHFYEEVIDFLSYKELGISQGYLLGFIVIIMGYAELRRPEPVTPLLIRWRKHLLARLMLVLLAVGVLTLSTMATLPNAVLLLIILSGVVLYQAIDIIGNRSI